jgi:hypothetical protein
MASGKTLLAVALRSAPLLRLLARVRPLRPSFSTQLIKVTFDLAHSSLSGTLLPSDSAGELAGSDIKALSDVQYQQLYTQWQQLDSQSALLLRGCRHGTASFNQQSSGTSDSTTLNIEQAAQVLGIERTASRDEIVAAHRRLIQRLHPDRGGSDYLAAQINQAKQVLLDAATNAS